MKLSPQANKVLVMGDFTSIGGSHREQVFMLDLGPTRGAVDPWTSTEFLGHCSGSETFYVQAAAWSPDQAAVYLASTGYMPNGSSTTAPRSGLCDSAAAFPATPASVTHRWINYAGCDSLYSIAADNTAVYVGGHQRRLNAPLDCDENNLASQPVASPGLGGIDPATGSVYTTTTGGLTGEYSRGRGLGADDMLLLPRGAVGAGLWVASDNYKATDTCGGITNKAGLCYLPYS